MAVTIKGATTIKGQVVLNWSPSLLFSNGQQGVWYDPSDFSTMFQDTAGTTPVTATGQSVGLIKDKSGNNNNAIQSTSGNRPILQQDASGKYYLDFPTAQNKSLVASANFLSSISGFTVFCGFLLNATNSNQAIYSAYGSSSSFDILSYFYTTTSVCLYQVNNGADNSALDVPTTSANTKYIDAFLFDGTQSVATNRISKWRNGAPVSLSTYSVPSTTPNLTGKSFLIADYGPAFGVPLWGRVYGLIAVASALNSGQIITVENWMNGKMGAY